MNSDKAVEHFYNWEIKGRGYILFDYPIYIEPTYRPFYHSFVSNEAYIDDGKVPTFFKRLFGSNREVIKEEEEEERPPKQFEYNPFLKQINICFPKIPDFDDSLSLEFLNMLGESEEQISFEIIGKHDSIEIQIVCSIDDYKRILHLLKAYFPESIIKDTNLTKLPFDTDSKILIVDFGYNDEFMRPLNTSIDGLTSIMAVIECLGVSDVVVLQIIFKGVRNTWANSILNSVGIGKDSFFPESPEMATCAKEKVPCTLR